MTSWRERHSVTPAVYIIFRKQGQVLLLKRANTGYRDGWYSMPSGHLDGGESARQAAVREAKEEVGVDIELADLHFVTVQHRMAQEGDHERVDFFFEVDMWRGEITNAEPDKCDELRWAAIDAMPPKLTPEIAQALQNIMNHQAYSDTGFDA